MRAGPHDIRPSIAALLARIGIAWVALACCLSVRSRLPPADLETPFETQELTEALMVCICWIQAQTCSDRASIRKLESRLAATSSLADLQTRCVDYKHKVQMLAFPQHISISMGTIPTYASVSPFSITVVSPIPHAAYRIPAVIVGCLEQMSIGVAIGVESGGRHAKHA